MTKNVVKNVIILSEKAKKDYTVMVNNNNNNDIYAVKVDEGEKVLKFIFDGQEDSIVLPLDKLLKKEDL